MYLLQVPVDYRPPGEAASLLPSSLRLDCDKRDARGGIKFSDFPAFRPTLRPVDVVQAGSFGGWGLLHALTCDTHWCSTCTCCCLVATAVPESSCGMYEL